MRIYQYKICEKNKKAKYGIISKKLGKRRTKHEKGRLLKSLYKKCRDRPYFYKQYVYQNNYSRFRHLCHL